MLKNEWLNNIYLRDSIEAMKKLPSECIDLCITDPPYKLNKTTGGLSVTDFNAKWQGNLRASDKTANIINNVKFSDWLPEVYRLLKPQSHFYVFVNDKNLQDILNEGTKAKFKLHNVLVWKKNNKTPNKYYMKDCEFIIFFRKGKSVPIHNLGDSQYQDHTYEEDDYYNDNEIWEEKVIECQNINGKDKLHPTQKPVKLLEKLILNSSSEGRLVFDPFMGSGSTAIAAINTNRKFLGFEIDEKYYKVSQERIRNKIS